MTEITNIKEGSIEQKILSAIDEVSDPHLPLSFVELSMVYEISFEEGVAEIVITYPCMGCPAYGMIQDQMADAARQVSEVTSVKVDITWEPVWSKEMLDEEARMKLEASGIAI